MGHARIPGKVEGVLDFIEKFETALSLWPSDAKWPLTHVAEITRIQLPHVVNYLAEVLEKASEVHDPITRKEADRALNLLKQKMRSEIEARQRILERQRNRAVGAYEKTMDIVRQQQSTKNWYGAYRTLSYFFGNYHAQLNNETAVTICNDALRIGIKAKVNFQELAQWLQKGIENILGSTSMSAVEDAIDFVDAYGEYFIAEDSVKGARLIQAIFNQLRVMALDPISNARLDELRVELNLSVPDLSA
jgi:SOS response regulatory protein OraA/RecX